MHVDAKVRSKIVSFESLRAELDAKPHARVVQCHGVFDLLHIGHIRHFLRAKNYGDILVVTITPDRFVNKGPNRPCFTEQLRAEAIASLDYVDYVVINAWPTAVEAIALVKPNVYVKGSEYQDASQDVTGKIQEEANAVRAVSGEIAFTDDITFSSSKLLNQFFSPFPPEVTHYLESFRQRYRANDVMGYLDRAKTLEVLVVGEAIIDIYHFSDVIGKAGKEPILVAKQKSIETYLGGTLALANHLGDFCKKVTCLTYLGENAEYESLIRAGLKKNVEMIPVYKKNSPTIVKRRYLDEYLRQKLFEVYEINDDFLESDQQDVLQGKLNELLKSHDLAIVADYGHGLLDDGAVKTLMQDSKFLAVNTQSNAGNNGFNCISKYPKADYVCIATRELQLNYRQRHLSVPEQLSRLSQDFEYQKIMITAGKTGAYAWNKAESDVAKVPALATSVVDRVGSGDAVLAITSLYAYFNAPSEITAFVGNVVGAEAVGIMGNQRSIEKTSLMKHLTHLLK